MVGSDEACVPIVRFGIRTEQRAPLDRLADGDEDVAVGQLDAVLENAGQARAGGPQPTGSLGDGRPAAVQGGQRKPDAVGRQGNRGWLDEPDRLFPELITAPRTMPVPPLNRRTRRLTTQGSLSSDSSCTVNGASGMSAQQLGLHDGGDPPALGAAGYLRVGGLHDLTHLLLPRLLAGL